MPFASKCAKMAVPRPRLPVAPKWQLITINGVNQDGMDEDDLSEDQDDDDWGTSGGEDDLNQLAREVALSANFDGKDIPSPRPDHHKLRQFMMNDCFKAVFTECVNCRRFTKVMTTPDPTAVSDEWTCAMARKPDIRLSPEWYPDRRYYIQLSYAPGSLVWTRQGGTGRWWPAMVDYDPDTESFIWMDPKLSTKEMEKLEGPQYYNVTYWMFKKQKEGESNDNVAKMQLDEDSPVKRAFIMPKHVLPFRGGGAQDPENSGLGRKRKRSTILPAAIMEESQRNASIEFAIGLSKMSFQDRLKEHSFLKKFPGPFSDQTGPLYKKSKKSKKNVGTEEESEEANEKEQEDTALEEDSDSDPTYELDENATTRKKTLDFDCTGEYYMDPAERKKALEEFLAAPDSDDASEEVVDEADAKMKGILDYLKDDDNDKDESADEVYSDCDNQGSMSEPDLQTDAEEQKATEEEETKEEEQPNSMDQAHSFEKADDTDLTPTEKMAQRDEPLGHTPAPLVLSPHCREMAVLMIMNTSSGQGDGYHREDDVRRFISEEFPGLCGPMADKIIATIFKDTFEAVPRLSQTYLRSCYPRLCMMIIENRSYITSVAMRNPHRLDEFIARCKPKEDAFKTQLNE